MKTQAVVVRIPLALNRKLVAMAKVSRRRRHAEILVALEVWIMKGDNHGRTNQTA